ncbi:LptF/LptG family permease [Desulfurobacterium thermolithotrophum]|uniref:LptF/LptG family permease n=1 Tax=Desulfurobacterium thermolithotrophum TaxID=64160 RepID=UPI0013D3BC73|nr:LptF/LptG family permease [Desulfurobacterium thermolithotrophum]
MRLKIIHRYIFLEILRVFILTLGLFIFVILMDRASSIAETVLGQGISILNFLSVLVKGIPAFLGMTIPMAFILSVLIVFIQLGNNNELVALKSCGVSTKELSKPVIFLGVAFSILSFYSLMFLMPKSNVAMKKEIEELVKKKITMSISPKNFSSNFPGVTFYVEKLYPEKGYLENFMVSLVKKDELITIFAKKGMLRTEKDTVFLDIQDGTGEFINWKKPENFKVLNFKNYTVKLYRFTKREKFESIRYKTLPELISSNRIEAKVELFKRLGLSLAPLIVGILAFSLVLIIPRSSIGVGILLSLLIIVVYYILYTLTKKIALNTGIVLLPLLTDLFFFVLGGFLYIQALKEKIELRVGGRW